MTAILVALASVFAYGRLTKTRPSKSTYALASGIAWLTVVVTNLLLSGYALAVLFETQSELDSFAATARGILILVGIVTAVLVAKFRRVSPTTDPSPEALAGVA